MLGRYRGKVGEYLWQKEQQRLDRYKDRPWELQSRSQTGGELQIVVLVCLLCLGTLLLLSLLF